MLFLLSITAFLIGSIPTGQIIAAGRGIDLKKAGSGNIGATNVLRTAGKTSALLTLAGDFLKGSVALWLARYFHAGVPYEGLIGICAILGHDFSIFMKFRGGKGVATSLGVLAIYSPPTALITAIIWLMIVLATKYSSLGAIISFGLLPVSIAAVDGKEKMPVALIISIILFIRHKDNIRRLLNRTEAKVGQKA